MALFTSFFTQGSIASFCTRSGIIGVLMGCPMTPWHLEVKETPQTITYNLAIAQGMLEGRFLTHTLNYRKSRFLRQAQLQALVSVTQLSHDPDDEDNMKQAGQDVAQLLWDIEHL